VFYLLAQDRQSESLFLQIKSSTSK